MSEPGWLERARAVRERVYGPPLPCGLRAVAVDAETYWARHEAELRPVFPPEVYLRARSLEARPPRPDTDPGRLEDWLLLLDGERLAGVASGFAAADPPDLYWTGHASLDVPYRGQGVYAELQRRVIAYTRELGFRAIQSQHAPSNNAAIVTKLRAGFRIVSLGLDAEIGPMLVLRYFHDPDEEAAYLYRNGLATLTPGLITSGHGAMATLRAQFRAADEAESGAS